MRTIMIVIFILAILVFALTFVLMLNPKLRDKLFGEHTELAAKRIKKGFMSVEKSFCKHCGAEIDQDSKFCKSCGKEQ